MNNHTNDPIYESNANDVESVNEYMANHVFPKEGPGVQVDWSLYDSNYKRFGNRNPDAQDQDVDQLDRDILSGKVN